MQRSLGVPLTVIRIDGSEIDNRLKDVGINPNATSEQSTGDPLVFALEKYLQEFLVSNWDRTDLGKDYKIYEVDDNKLAGSHYLTDTGQLDILAERRDGTGYLVVELKKDIAEDKVVGQVTRYMGFVQEVIASADQEVRGLVIAFDDSLRLRRSLSMVPNVEFLRYAVNFDLIPT